MTVASIQKAHKAQQQAASSLAVGPPGRSSSTLSADTAEGSTSTSSEPAGSSTEQSKPRGDAVQAAQQEERCRQLALVAPVRPPDTQMLAQAQAARAQLAQLSAQALCCCLDLAGKGALGVLDVPPAAEVPAPPPPPPAARGRGRGRAGRGPGAVSVRDGASIRQAAVIRVRLVAGCCSWLGLLAECRASSRWQAAAERIQGPTSLHNRWLLSVITSNIIKHTKITLWHACTHCMIV
jgi:hypothetical protein